MIRAPVWCELVCRSCADSTAGEFTWSKIQKRQMIASARSQGWIFKHNEVFCSEKCLERFEMEKNETSG